MKILRLSFMIVSLLLSACSYAAPSPPTATVQAPTIGLPSNEVTSTPLLIPLPTETSTGEPVVVTDTFQPTDTLLPTSTPTSGMTMQIVSEGTQPIAPQSSGQTCGQPPNWAAYTVQRSDTLSSLAQRTGTSVQQIQAANCLAGTLIFAGQILYLPFVPAPSTGPNALTPIKTQKAGLPGDHTVNISPSSGPPGTEFTLSVDEYASNEKVIISILTVDTEQSILEQTLYTDDDGNLIWFYKSPGDLAERQYKVFEIGMQSGAIGTGSFSITAPLATTTP